MRKLSPKDGMELRFLAMKKGLTNRAIAKALGCHEDLVSKAFKLQRVAAFERVRKYVKSFKPKKAA